MRAMLLIAFALFSNAIYADETIRWIALEKTGECMPIQQGDPSLAGRDSVPLSLLVARINQHAKATIRAIPEKAVNKHTVYTLYSPLDKTWLVVTESLEDCHADLEVFGLGSGKTRASQ